MRRMLASYLTVAGLLLGLAGGAWAEPPEEAAAVEKIAGSARTLASASVAGRQLALRFSELPARDPRERLLPEAAGETLRANRALALVDAPGQVAWLAWGFEPEGMYPKPTHHAAIVPDPERRTAWVVLARALTWNLRLQAYRADPGASLGAFPQVIAERSTRGRPVPSPPLAQLERQLIDDRVCTVTAIEAELVNGDLQVRAERDQGCPPAFFLYDPERNAWSEIEVKGPPAG